MGGGALIQFILLLRDRQRAGERERERERAGQREGRREREREGRRERERDGDRRCEGTFPISSGEARPALKGAGLTL